MRASAGESYLGWGDFRDHDERYWTKTNRKRHDESHDRYAGKRNRARVESDPDKTQRDENAGDGNRQQLFAAHSLREVTANQFVAQMVALTTDLNEDDWCECHDHVHDGDTQGDIWAELR